MGTHIAAARITHEHQLISYIAMQLYHYAPGLDSWTDKFAQDLDGIMPTCPPARPRQVASALINVAKQRGDSEIANRLLMLIEGRTISWASLSLFRELVAKIRLDEWAHAIERTIQACKLAHSEKAWLEEIRGEAVIRHCDLCWRSAIWFKRGTALCSRHVPTSAREDRTAGEHQAALRIRRKFQKKVDEVRREYRAERWSVRRARFQSAAKLLARFPLAKKLIGNAGTFRELVARLDTQNYSVCSDTVRPKVENLVAALHKLVEQRPETIVTMLIRAEAWARAKEPRAERASANRRPGAKAIGTSRRASDTTENVTTRARRSPRLRRPAE